MTKAQRDIRRKLRILTYATEIGDISKACRYFGISRQGFYKWEKAYAAHGEIYSRHTQKNAILFIDYVVSKFPFRIHTIRTDNGHEFQAKFHWHAGDLGIRHIYNRPRSPTLNGKLERSHATDEIEFYQL